MRRLILILAACFALGGCVDVATIPTQIEAGDEVADIDISTKDTPETQ